MSKKDEDLRAWMARYLMEFGSGPVTIRTFLGYDWYQNSGDFGPAYRVEDWSDCPTRGKHPGAVFFHWDNSAEDPDERTYELTQAGLDFIKGDDDDQERIPG